MALFRRSTPGGRHALGAAVTAIPSGPVVRVVPVPHVPPVLEPVLPSPEPVAVEPVAVPAPEAEPVVPAAPPSARSELMASIAELLATGEAWSVPVEQLDAMLSAPLPVTRRSPSTVPAAAPVVPAVPEQPAPVAAAPVVPAQPAPARSALEAALADLLPSAGAASTAEPAQRTVAAPAVPQPPVTLHSLPSGPRVSLGFRDGSTAELDPDSDSSLALELLAQSLAQRD